MEFLVNISIAIPLDMEPDRNQQLVNDERQMAADLAAKGHLKRMWRVPGRRENWGLWEAEDATELHTIISQLPVWPWMDVHVTPLSRHPVDPATRPHEG